ncbi:MAG: polysaccharide deacetylase family protein [Thiohalomonadaceae bacterium]
MPCLRPLLFLLLLAAAGCAAAASHAVVFMYHRFGEDRYPSTSIRLEQFDAQLDYLAQNGYQVWPLERIVTHLLHNEPLPERTIAITVDDAYLSVYEHAWPRLKARGWPFTVFVNTDPVDRGLSGFMTWEQMRAMQKEGVRFANHTASHDSMAERRADETAAAWERRVRADIERAQRRLREELGEQSEQEPRLFAYPYGEYDTRAADLVQAMGYIGFGQQSGAIGPLSDRRALPRYPMAEGFAALEPFARKAGSLPLPVLQAAPWEPHIGSNNPPQLTLTLQRPLRGIACYNAAGQPLPLTWLDDTRFQVQAADRLPRGRSRYNCTAPAGDGRWYWYSHPWLVDE